MKHSNVQSSRGVTLVGGGAPKSADIRLLMAHAPVLIAADGGANACVAAGLTPSAVIGDFDSLEASTKDRLKDTQLLHIAEQDSTDFEKSLTNIDAPFILATGFTSARLDHTLAALSALIQHRATPVIVLGDNDVVFAARDHLVLDLAPGTRVSIFPMSEVTGSSTGLAWPIDDLILAPNGRIGTSNVAEGPVTLRFAQTDCLIILPREALLTALHALTGSTAVPER